MLLSKFLDNIQNCFFSYSNNIKRVYGKNVYAYNYKKFQDLKLIIVIYEFFKYYINIKYNDIVPRRRVRKSLIRHRLFKI